MPEIPPSSTSTASGNHGSPCDCGGPEGTPIAGCGLSSVLRSLCTGSPVSIGSRGAVIGPVRSWAGPFEPCCVSSGLIVDVISLARAVRFIIDDVGVGVRDQLTTDDGRPALATDNSQLTIRKKVCYPNSDEWYGYSY